MKNRKSHYSIELRNELEEQRKLLVDVGFEIRALRIYLQSSKFHDDTTVQVKDILNRLDVIAEPVAGFMCPDFYKR